MPLEWKEEYSVNVAEIDEQHKKFLGLLNRLYDAIAHHEIESKLEPTLDELIKYAEHHFDTEEKYFEKFNYEYTKEHKKAHDKIKTILIRFKEQLHSKKKEITFDLVDFLENWLVDHLSSQDKKYSECFNEHGLY